MSQTASTPEEIATAYHEAGHAVIALALGRPIHKVTVQPNHLRMGVCHLSKGAFRPSQDALETEALILLAGLAAEARHTGVYRWDGAALDLRAVRNLTEMRGGSIRQVEKLERRWLDKVEYLLEQPGVWPAVEAVAAELLSNITISGRAARHLYDQAVGRAQRTS